jgi:putative ABC transport system permease protein
MFKNYLKIALRNLKKNKAFSFINIAGLAIGMACCILILLYVSDELSYDNFHENEDRIYRILSFSTIGGTTREFAMTPPAMVPVLAQSIPEIESFVRIFRFPNIRIRYQDKNFNMSDFFLADSSFFDFFSHQFLTGDSKTALKNPNSMVITEDTAKQIFGDEDPLGKTISFFGGQLSDIKITGIIKNVPNNSHYTFNLVLSINTLTSMDNQQFNRFLTEAIGFSVYSYVLLKEGAEPVQVKEKIMEVVENKWGKALKERGIVRDYPLQKLRDIHLMSNYEAEIGNPGNINYIYLFSAVALLVLFIACFNFINLSTARSIQRAKEVGLRKVFGAFRGQLVKQFLFESIFMSFLGLVIGIITVILILPTFNGLTGKTFSSAELLSSTIILAFLAIIILTGFFAGSFPAFILSSFNPVKTVKGKLGEGSKKLVLRKTLVMLQFSISIFMIFGILVILKQMDYLKNKDLGFNKEQSIVIPSGGRNPEALTNRILQNPRIKSVTFSQNIPGQFTGDDTYFQEGRNREETTRVSAFTVDHDFFKTFEIKLLHGRLFSKKFPTDATESIIINEEAAREFGWGADSIGKMITNTDRGNIRKRIIGIVNNFHHKSLKHKINPTVLELNTEFYNFAAIRISHEDVSSTIAYLKKLWKETNPQFQFRYFFIDDDFRMKYPEEEKVRQIYFYFGILAIFVACLGLYGLSSYTIMMRTKEIGIRKVLGSSFQSIVIMLTKDFLKWVSIANIIAWPLAYFIMNRWLQNFAYRISIEWWIFLVSGIIALFISLIIVGFEAQKSARSNPINALRYE